MHKLTLRRAMTMCLGIAVAGMPLLAMAESAEGPEPEAPPRMRRIGIGVGVVVNQSPYERGGSRVVAIPALTYVGKRVSLLGTSAQLRLGSLGPAQMRAQVRYSFERFDTDSDELAGLERRRDTVMGGAGMRVALPAGLALDLLGETDLLDRHGGQRATAGLARSWRLAGIDLTPVAGVEWLGSATAAHRYGVSEGEARDDRPAYEPGSTLSGILGLGAQYTIGTATTLMARGSLTLLDTAIQDSPIVVRDTLFSVFLALSYSL